MHSIVDIIPLFLHVSLFFFYGGLIAFLLPVNRVLIYLMAVVLAMFTGIYVYFTVLPMISFDSPFHTPLSKFTWFLWQWYSNPNKLHGQSSILSLAETVVRHSKLPGDERDKRDDKAVEWTVKSLTDDRELLPFVEAIPDIVYGPNGLRKENAHLFRRILSTDDPQTSIVQRITDLMHGSHSSWVDDSLRTRRQNACCKALWSLAIMIISDLGELFPENQWQRFGFHDLRDVLQLWSIGRKEEYTTSAIVAVDVVRMTSNKDLDRILIRLTILIQYLTTAFEAQILPYNFSTTCEAIWPNNYVMPFNSDDASNVLQFNMWNMFSSIPNPSDNADLQTPDIHDIDMLVMEALSLLPYILRIVSPHDILVAADYTSRYIASRNYDWAVERILQHCNINDFTDLLTRTSEISGDIAYTVGILCRLNIDWDKADKQTFVNTIFSKL